MAPRRRRPPWEDGFRLRWDGEAVPFLRARGVGGELRASTYQYHPRYLLFRADAHWHYGTMADIVRRLRRLLNPEQGHGLDIILRGESRVRECEHSPS